MKKKLLTFLCILAMSASVVMANSENTTNSLVGAIKLYKAGNYSECYTILETVLKNDPANALAYYYMGMTATQIGRKDEAISNYEKAIALSPKGNNLERYAKKGKRCIESPDKCEETLFDTVEEELINKKGLKFSEEVKSDFERLKIENFMREMNRNDAIEPQRFKEYKDFSAAPTNDEVVAALRTLQRAGFGNLVNNNYPDLSVLTGNSQQNSMLNMMGANSMNPMLIQALLTNNMTQGF